MQTPPAPTPTPAPKSWTADLTAGFLVFLIALPLCLGIAMASSFPPIAGVLTAIIGGIVATWIGSSPLTIKGPAAGLIVIALGAVTELGAGDLALGYRRALAVGVIAAIVQIIFAFMKTGRLGEIFPPSVVHGMLAAIGVIIVSKQAHVMLGVTPTAKSPLALLAEVPHSIMNLNPEIAIVGALSLIVLFGLPLLPFKWTKRVPGPMAVLLLAVPLGIYFDLAHVHTYTMAQHTFTVGPQYLVKLSGDLISALTFPDFSVVTSAASIKYIVMFALVGSIESLLSAKAVDLLDPWKRKSNMDKDLLSVGVGNLIASCLGGLPMISEIVRSKANIDNGAYTRRSNFFHGIFLLGFVALLPGLIQRIPMAALGAMLVYTGFRLASPKEFVHSWQVGKEQFILFTTTLVVTLATDLLIGVAVGVALKIVMQMVVNHLSPSDMFKSHLKVESQQGQATITVEGAAVFCNYLALHSSVNKLIDDGVKHLSIDLSKTRFIDHTTMERLHDLEHALIADGGSLTLEGMDHLKASSDHPRATRRHA